MTFDSNGGSTYEPIHKFDYDPITSLPTPEKDGEIFSGWYIGETKIETPFIPDDYESVTLVAHWNEDFESQIINNGLEVEILSYAGTDTELFLPNRINTLPVTSIAADAFLNNSTIIKVVGGNNLTSIGNNSFKGCASLREVNFPSLSSIGENALLGASSLDSLSIGSPTFSLLNAFGFEETNLPSSFATIKINKNFTGENLSILFKFISAKLFDLIIGKQVASLSFDGNKIVKKVNFENGSMLTSIGDFTFSSCTSLTSIEIPNSITSIGDYAFYNCTSLTSIVIPSSVTSIGREGFSNCASLTSVMIPNSVTSIGIDAFSSCASLTSIVIPDSVASIGGGAFSSCSSLTSIVIPNSVTSIGNYAFYECRSLLKVYYAGTMSNWFNNVAIGSNNEALNNASMSYESTVSDIELINDGTLEYLLTNNDEVFIVKCIDKSLVDINLETYFNGYIVISIGINAFSECRSLTSIVMPSSLTFISNFAFWNCSSLASIEIPNGVTHIGQYAFGNCTSFISMVIPSSVTFIDDFAFWNCSSLISTVIPNSVTYLGNEIFAYCSYLTIFAEASSQPSGWDADWNYQNRPVVWGYTGA